MKIKVLFVPLRECKSSIRLKYLFIIISFISISIIKAQETLDFKNPTLVSGNDLQFNAKYRFQNVTTTSLGINIDCLVTISSFQKAALNQFDDNADCIGNGKSSLIQSFNLNGNGTAIKHKFSLIEMVRFC